VIQPAWWADGVPVVDAEGATGIVAELSSGWIVHLDTAAAGIAYIVNPDPDAWRPLAGAKVTIQRLRRILYDADRALCLAYGCGGIPEWIALPESTRTAPRPPLAQPRNRGDLAGLRAILRDAIETAFAEHLEA
jgi:hypothetical protein